MYVFCKANITDNNIIQTIKYNNKVIAWVRKCINKIKRVKWIIEKVSVLLGWLIPKLAQLMRCECVYSAKPHCCMNYYTTTHVCSFSIQNLYFFCQASMDEDKAARTIQKNFKKFHQKKKKATGLASTHYKLNPLSVCHWLIMHPLTKKRLYFYS